MNRPVKKVRVIEANKTAEESIKEKYLQKRVAAYCRVSTQQEEQLNSYAVQVKHYTDRINSEPKWKLVGIYADKGISGTSTKNRDEFNKMIRMCKRGKIDMIITKSISRFARNTVDCLKYIRLLKDFGVDVFFEEQGIHSMSNGTEFYITVYGSLAQSESENISANVRWGKEQSAKEGNIQFRYKNTLGYKKGIDGNPEIVPEEAEIIKYIYQRFISGASYGSIKAELENKDILSPSGNKKWSYSTIRSILTNERYKGDMVINKTYVVDCISKKVKKNNGERNKYYIENNHPAIVDAVTFGKVQEELARRNSKKKVKQIGTKTELGKYSSKYALTELLVCGECGTAYRRCTWTASGEKRIVWRCIKRLDFGKKYCHNSPTLEEDVLQKAIMEAVKRVALRNCNLLKTLKTHIASNLKCEMDEDRRLDIKVRLAEIDAEFKNILSMLSTDMDSNAFAEKKITDLMAEKRELELELVHLSGECPQSPSESKLNEISRVTDHLQNQPLMFDDILIRQILSCVVVLSKEKIRVVFKDGTEIDQSLSQEQIEKKDHCFSK